MPVKMFGAEPKEKKVPATKRWNGNYPEAFVISKYQQFFVRILSGNALTSETQGNTVKILVAMKKYVLAKTTETS